MLVDYNKIHEKILDIKHGRIAEGLKMDIPEIDDYFRYKQNNFNLVIGHANVGKTTIMCFLFTVWAMKHKLKFVIWSSENTPESLVRKIIEFKMGEPIHTANEDKIKKAIDWCNTYFKILDVEELTTYKVLLKKITAIKEAWDYQAVLIDPYNSLSRDYQLMKAVGSHEYDYQCSTEFRLFAKKNNVTVYLNAHGVTEAMRRTHPKGHDYENLTIPLRLGDVEGGGKWSNRADDVLCIHRYTNHPSEWMFSHLHVLKVKENETGGRCTPFEEPIKLRMALNNVGFEFLGKNILHTEKSQVKELLNF
jgi:KaiC/GvpD/RAD55 family RecA-like ATPase